MRVAIPSTVICLMLAVAGPALRAQPAPAAIHPLGLRSQLVAAVEALPEARLRDLFLSCSSEASQRLLPRADAVACAIAWDTLLRREYGGDIDSLLAWWREHRDVDQPRQPRR